MNQTPVIYRISLKQLSSAGAFLLILYQRKTLKYKFFRIISFLADLLENNPRLDAFLTLGISRYHVPYFLFCIHVLPRPHKQRFEKALQSTLIIALVIILGLQFPVPKTPLSVHVAMVARSCESTLDKEERAAIMTKLNKMPLDLVCIVLEFLGDTRAEILIKRSRFLEAQCARRDSIKSSWSRTRAVLWKVVEFVLDLLNDDNYVVVRWR